MFDLISAGSSCETEDSEQYVPEFLHMTGESSQIF